MIVSLFNGNLTTYESYIEKASESLDYFRNILECHNDNHNGSLDEVTQFQLLFQCLLRELTSPLNEVSSDATSSQQQSKKFDVKGVNGRLLSFEAEVYTGNDKTTKLQTISGFSDLSIAKKNSRDGDDDNNIHCLIELKSPPALSKYSENTNQKNQAFLQLFGFKDECKNGQIPRVIMTDAFAIYIFFALDGINYISGFVYETRDYLDTLLFQLCDLNATALQEVIDVSGITEEIDICDDIKGNQDKNISNPNMKPKESSTSNKNTQSKSKSSSTNTKRKHADTTTTQQPLDVINFNYEDQMTQYQDKVAYISKIENDLWGYGNIDQENLENYARSNNNNNSSNYIMSKFLSDV